MKNWLKKIKFLILLNFLMITFKEIMKQHLINPFYLTNIILTNQNIIFKGLALKLNP